MIIKSSVRRVLLLLVFIVVPHNSVLAENASSTKGKGDVNEALASFHKSRFSQEKLISAGEGVKAAYTYAYSNFSFVETGNGTVVIDSGWYANSAKRALQAYREISSKPIVAIIYTHIHTDHTGGSAVFLQDAGGNIPVIAPKGWERYRSYLGSPLNSMVSERAVAQMGIILPVDEHGGTVGAGIGVSPRLSGGIGFAEPTQSISGRTEMNIDGLDIVFIPAAGDIQENIMVWLPKQKTLIMGDQLGGTFPYIATARFEPDRNPRDFISTINTSLELKPDYVIPGHGRILLGQADVKDVLEITRDVTQFMVDQLDRMVIKGLTADQVIDRLKLPSQFANHPDLQPYYHRLDWIIRQMHIKRTGFFGREVDLVKLTDSEQSKRLVELLGGANVVLAQTQQAMDQGDYRWAASLVTKVLDNQPKLPAAKQLLNEIFAEIAKTTSSANERNYLLSYINEGTGKLLIEMDDLLIRSSVRALSSLSNADILKQLSAHFKAESADDVSIIIGVQIDEEKSLQMRAHNNVLVYLGEDDSNADAQIKMPRSVLIKYMSKQLAWSELASNNEVQLSGDKTQIEQFVQLID